jgi:hypothetical protein
MDDVISISSFDYTTLMWKFPYKSSTSKENKVLSWSLTKSYHFLFKIASKRKLLKWPTIISCLEDQEVRLKLQFYYKFRGLLLLYKLTTKFNYYLVVDVVNITWNYKLIYYNSHNIHILTIIKFNYLITHKQHLNC